MRIAYCATRLLIDTPISYAVPKEVGKVGTESPTFIQPVSERKDGIQAMFARQNAAQSPVSQAKRKRSTSPQSASQGTSPPKKSKMITEDNTPHKTQPEVIDLCDSDEGRKPEDAVEKLDTWEDSSNIEYLDHGGSSSPKTVSDLRTMSYAVNQTLALASVLPRPESQGL